MRGSCPHLTRRARGHTCAKDARSCSEEQEPTQHLPRHTGVRQLRQKPQPFLRPPPARPIRSLATIRACT